MPPSSDAETPLPALRPLDAFPVREAEGLRFVLKDPEGFSDAALALSPAAYFIAACLDGASGVDGVREAFAREFGGRKPAREQVLEVVRTLDRHHFLDSHKFRARRQRLEGAYRRAKSRPAAFAGAGYPAEPAELDALLSGFFAAPPPARAPGRLAGLVAPHIDFFRGGASYAKAYAEWLSREPAPLVVALGVAHATPPDPLVLSLKDYETPFGPVPADRELGEAWAAQAPELTRHELAHRREHSLEFQAVWLGYAARRGRARPRLLPVLCAGHAGPEPDTLRPLEALAKLLKARGGPVCLLAGADLAHVGPRFGDDCPASELMEEVRERDRAGLERVLAKDAEGFRRSVDEDGNRRRVCGVGALFAFTWLLSRLAPEAEGRLLDYASAEDPSGGEVSFASLAFTVP